MLFLKGIEMVVPPVWNSAPVCVWSLSCRVASLWVASTFSGLLDNILHLLVQQFTSGPLNVLFTPSPSWLRTLASPVGHLRSQKRPVESSITLSYHVMWWSVEKWKHLGSTHPRFWQENATLFSILKPSYVKRVFVILEGLPDKESFSPSQCLTH